MKTAILLFASPTQKAGKIFGDPGSVAELDKKFKEFRKGGKSPFDGLDRMFLIDIGTGEKVRSFRFRRAAKPSALRAEDPAPAAPSGDPDFADSPGFLLADPEPPAASPSPSPSRRRGRNPGDGQK